MVSLESRTFLILHLEFFDEFHFDLHLGRFLLAATVLWVRIAVVKVAADKTLPFVEDRLQTLSRLDLLQR